MTTQQSPKTRLASIVAGRYFIESMKGKQAGKLAMEDPEEEAAYGILDARLEKVKHGYWKPPYNLLLNQALMGLNLWRFTILPFFWKRVGYRKDLNGIVLHPTWTSVEEGSAIGRMDMSGFWHLTPEVAEKVVKVIEGAETIPETVKRELKMLETTFGIDIPDQIKNTIAKDSVKVAKRRWGASGQIKDRLIPLDGSKPRDLGMFDI